MAGLELGLKDRHGEPVAEMLDGAMFRHPAGVSGLGALALGALRAAGAGTPPGGPGAGAAGAAAEAIGRAAAGGDSCRSRSVPVPRRRPSQGPRTASDPGWDPSRPHAGAARHAGARTALPAPRASGRREDPRREGHHPGAQRDVGDGRRAGIHARRRVGLDLRGGRTLERGVRGVATCAKSGAASRHSIRLRKGSNVSMARWTPTSPAGWRFGWITVVSTCQTTSSSRSGIGGSTPASALSRNRKRTVWRSGGIVRSRSKRSTAESFRTSRPSAPPWPTSWSGTTRPGALRSLGIKRRSRRARSMSYARRHSTNVCPGNRVRYTTTIMPPCDRSPSHGCGFSFAAGRTEPHTTKPGISTRYADTGRHSSKIWLDGTTQMSMPPSPILAVTE